MSEVELAHSEEYIPKTLAPGVLYTGRSYNLRAFLCSEECLTALYFWLGAGLPVTASHFMD